VNGVSQLYVPNAFTYEHMGRAKDTRQNTGDLSTTTNPKPTSLELRFGVIIC